MAVRKVTTDDGIVLKTASDRRYVIFANVDGTAYIYRRSDNLDTARKHYYAAAYRTVLADMRDGVVVLDTARARV